MSMKMTLDSQGRIQLPVTVQTQLGVKPGDDLFLEQQDSLWFICSKSDAAGLAWKDNVLVHQGTGTALADDSIGQIREQRLEQLGTSDDQ
jgi:bifunctional DNA-binding transcriptional regulator/antitoxin component of YhaV-PrlF toxin-antitoxin module